MRSFLACKKARRFVLEKIWYKMERKVALTEDSDSYKGRKGSVLPLVGNKMESASRRYSVLEKQIQLKNIIVEHNVKDKEGQEEGHLVEMTPKGVPLELMRFLIR